MVIWGMEWEVTSSIIEDISWRNTGKLFANKFIGFGWGYNGI
jgi:hypothetical protein